MEFPETQSSIQVHTISEMSHTSNVIKQLRTQTLHTVVMEFPETQSSILVHTISEMSHTSNVIVVFVCVYPK